MIKKWHFSVGWGYKKIKRHIVKKEIKKIILKNDKHYNQKNGYSQKITNTHEN